MQQKPCLRYLKALGLKNNILSMKKIISLSICLLFLATTIISSSEGIRNTGYNNLKEHRRFSNRIGPFSYRKKFNNYSEKKTYWMSRSVQKFKPSIFAAFYTRVSQDKNTMPDKHQTHNPVLRNFPVRRNFHVRGNTARSLKKPILFTNDRSRLLEPQEYIIKTPREFNRNQYGVYKNNKSTLSFRIVRTPEKYTCTPKNFNLCAISLNNHIKNTQNLGSTTHHIKVPRSSQSRAHTFLKYPTFIESFKGNAFGSDNVYFIFNTLDPKDGSVIRIEAVGNEQETTSAAKIMFEVFESFRF